MKLEQQLKQLSFSGLAAALLLMIVPEQAFAMHIMEGFLPPMWALAWWLLFLPCLWYGLVRLRGVLLATPHWRWQVTRGAVGFSALFSYFYAITLLPLATAVNAEWSQEVTVGCAPRNTPVLAEFIWTDFRAHNDRTTERLRTLHAAVAALAAASRNDRAAGAGAHASAEAVHLGAAAVVGLERALAHVDHSGSAGHPNALDRGHRYRGLPRWA